MSGVKKINVGLIMLSTALFFSLAVYPSACLSAEGVALQVLVDASEETGVAAEVEGLLGVQHVGFWDEQHPAWKAFIHGGLKHVRGYCLEPEVEVFRDNGKSRVRINFESVDRQMANSRSMKNVPGFNFAIPQALSSKPEAVQYDPEGVMDHFSMYAPADYGLWNDYVAQLVKHLVEKWGMAGAYYEILNEPEDYTHYWKGRPGSADLMGDYLEFYVHTARAIKSTDPAARVGGPASSHWKVSAPEIGGKWGVEEFLRALARHNRKHPDAVAPLDFVSWHDYAWAGSRMLDGADYIDRILAELEWRSRPEYLITEWNLTFGQPDGQYTAQQFSSHAAYNLITIAGDADQRISRLYYYTYDLYAGEYVSMIDCAPQDGSGPPGKKYTDALRPVYAVYRMMQTLHGGRVLKVDAETPLVAIAVKGDGQIRVLLNNNTPEAHLVRIEWKGMLAPPRSECLVQRVDGSHSSDGKGLEKGSGEKLLKNRDRMYLEHELEPYAVELLTIRIT